MNAETLVSDALVRALGWTLVHSLWQGAAAALFLLVLLPRLRSARLRYRAAYTALSAMFGAALITFGWVYTPAGNKLTGSSDGPEPSLYFPNYLAENQALDATFGQAVYGWLESHYSLIVAVWLLGFIFFLLRLASGLWYVEHLRRQGTFLVAGHWHDKMAAFGRQLGIPVAVGLFESALVHTPTALGWFKPLVLLPIGLLNRLAPEEVEAILAHELAHIARRDWIFNLLQAFIEALFYYHPAVWWMSQLIRSERENACDDDALAATGNRLAYAKALVQVQEMAKPAPIPALALGMSGSRRFLLLERIRRVLNQPQQKSQIMEKFIATAILLILLTFVGIRANHSPSLSAAFAQITEVPKAMFGFQSDDNQSVNDSIPRPSRTRKIIREEDDRRVEAEFRDGKLARLNIDGKEVPESEFSEHKELVNDLRHDLRPIAPPVPPGFYLEMPAVPGAPAPPGAPRLSTTKDGEGNTVIRLERNGKPMEIRVKDGEVWIDGDKLEDGESVDLPGLGGNEFLFFNDNDGNRIQFTPEGLHFQDFEGFQGFDNPVIVEMPELQEMPEAPEPPEGPEDVDRMRYFERLHWSEQDLQRLREESLRWREDADRAVKEQMERIREQLHDSKKLRKEQEKALEEQLRALQSDLRRQQKEQRKAMEEARKEMRRAQIAQKEAQYDMRRAHEEQAKGEVLREVFRSQLQRDGLISDPNNYSLQLSSEKMTVNGKEQSTEIRQKYLELYEARSGRNLSKNGNFSISENNN